MNNQGYYNMLMEDDLKIDFKKIFLAVWSRKILIIKVFVCTLIFFISLTYILPKKWNVEADLYINKTNNTNMIDINPYYIEEGGMPAMMTGSSGSIMNEIELISSPLVMDKVIKENDLRFNKLFGIIPTIKTGELMTTEKFLKKVKIEPKKGTNVVSISFKSKDRDFSYNVVTSIITHYIELRKELMSEKSKSDKKVIEAEYNRTKADLTKKVNAASGLPTNTMTGTGNLAAMSAFSKSAQTAMSSLKGQYIAGEKTRVEISEEATKVASLSSKLEWARLVEEMSDSSKVLVIKEPHHLKDWEFASPRLFINILLGIVFGTIFSLIALIYVEKTDKKLSYSILGDNIIYDLDKEFKQFSLEIISNSDNKTAFIFFEEMSKSTFEKFKDFANVIPLKADISNSFKDALKNTDNVVTFASIGKTSSEEYKLVKKMMTNLGKNIIYEVIV